MEAINRIPKILKTVEQMRQNYDIEKVFDQYKQNVRLFIESMKEEVTQIINNYQTAIASLKQEIILLKKQQTQTKFMRTPQMSDQFLSTNSPFQAKLSDLMKSTNSNVSTPLKYAKMDNLPMSSIQKKMNGQNDLQFPEEFVGHENSLWDKTSSKFQQTSKRRKQREQQLLLFLSSGKKNLDVTTDQFLSVIGRNNPRMKEQEQKQQDLLDKVLLKKQQSLNKSLGQICESLNTSFVSKKARSQKRKKMGQVQQQKKRKEALQRQTAKMLKDKGIKSLLQQLRNNVQTSAHQAPQIIRSSKLMSTGVKSVGKDQSVSPVRKNSKVMINPVPIDIARKSRDTSRSRDFQMSPDHKPQSILKRSSTILSRSISGFSVNDFTL